MDWNLAIYITEKIRFTNGPPSCWPRFDPRNGICRPFRCTATVEIRDVFVTACRRKPVTELTPKTPVVFPLFGAVHRAQADGDQVSTCAATGCHRRVGRGSHQSGSALQCPPGLVRHPFRCRRRVVPEHAPENVRRPLAVACESTDHDEAGVGEELIRE
jgi:hypothetical protein